MKFDKLLALVITFMIVVGTIPVIVSGVSMTKREDKIEYESYEIQYDFTEFTKENILMVMQLISSGTVYKIDLMLTTLNTFEVGGELTPVGTITGFKHDYDFMFISNETLTPSVSFKIIGTDSTTSRSLTQQTDGTTYTANGVLNKGTGVNYIKLYGVVKVGV